MLQRMVDGASSPAEPGRTGGTESGGRAEPGAPPTQAELVEALTRPDAYPHRPPAVEVGHTHISHLFFAGDRVYKVKRPVDLGFLDFTTLERRHRFCREEVRLNRRLTPETYLGVVPVTRAPDGALRVEGEGEVVEWAVAMRLLPRERMLDRLLERGEVDNGQMQALAELLADFHARAPTGEGVDRYGTPDAVAELVLGNLAELDPYVGPLEGSAAPGAVLSPERRSFLAARLRAFTERERELLQRRVEGGRIREGHGDLHAANICYADAQIAIYDCIEFSAAFRCGDVAADLAFLSMDVAHRGYPAFARYLVRAYALCAQDRELRRLVPFYAAHRALVRAKVAAIGAGDASAPDAERAARHLEALAYVDRATGFALPPALLLTCGLPASGKSWLGHRLARPLDAAVHRSDVRRKRLARAARAARTESGFDRGAYTPEMTERTYRDLLERAVKSLLAGRSVVVDATFARRDHRAAFVDAAARLGAPWLLVHSTASEARTAERMARRAGDAREPSEADFAVYLRARERFEAPDELPADRVVVVESGHEPVEEVTARVLDRLVGQAPA